MRGLEPAGAAGGLQWRGPVRQMPSDQTAETSFSIPPPTKPTVQVRVFLYKRDNIAQASGAGKAVLTRW